MAHVNDRPPPPDALLLFGVTGDLAHKMTFPALDAMVEGAGLQAMWSTEASTARPQTVQE